MRYAFNSYFDQRKGKKPARKSKTQSTVRFTDVDLNEDEDEDMEDAQQDASESGDEEEEEEGDPSEFIDVLDILDGRGEPLSEDKGAEPEVDALKKMGEKDLAESDEDDEVEAEDEDEQNEEDVGADFHRAESDEEEEEDASEGSQEGEESDHDISASEGEDDAENPDALTNLQTFLTSLDAGQKRKVPEDETTAQQDEKKAKKRKFLKERTEAGAENEFAAHVGMWYFCV